VLDDHWARRCEDYLLALDHRPYGHGGDPDKSTLGRARLRAEAVARGGTGDDWYEAYCSLAALRRGRRRWGEKTPRHILRIDDIIAVHPAAQVVCLIRDPRAVVCSYRDWAGSRPDLPTEQRRIARSYDPGLIAGYWPGAVERWRGPGRHARQRVRAVRTTAAAARRRGRARAAADLRAASSRRQQGAPRAGVAVSAAPEPRPARGRANRNPPSSLSVALSVIIPAHDEEAVIGACLRSLAGQDHEGPAQVVVVANGCRDATAVVARGFRTTLGERGIELAVLELPRRRSLRHSTRATRRPATTIACTLDADIELSPNALTSIAAAFTAGSTCICAPRIVLVATGYLANVYARIWGRLPYVAGEVIGAGVYAARGDARRRWGLVPDIGADDKFARLHFEHGERRVLMDSQFTAYLPAGTRELVRVRGRWIRNNRELRRRFPELTANDKRRFAGLVAFVCRNPALWKDMPAFLLLYGCAEIAAVVEPAGDRWPRAERARRLRAGSASGGRSASVSRTTAT
jgi:glycosyltransferase involved in cell wall biosynthesis